MGLHNVGEAMTSLGHVRRTTFTLLDIKGLGGTGPRSERHGTVIRGSFFRGDFFCYFLVLGEGLPVGQPTTISTLSIRASYYRSLSSQRALPCTTRNNFRCTPPKTYYRSLQAT